MLVSDASERGMASVLGDLASELQVSALLEALTGADLMISPLNIPLAPVLLPQHMDAGAVLVQIKRGADFTSSIGERMNTSIARMRSVCWRSSQCVLLFVGTISRTADGETLMNDKPMRVIGNNVDPYRIVMGAISAWNMRGGTFEQVRDLDWFKVWVEMKHKQVKQIAGGELVKMVYEEPPQMTLPKPDDPLQIPLVVDDWRNTLATFPGIGEKKVEALQTRMVEHDIVPSLIGVLQLLTDRERICSVPGFGEGLHQKALDWLGMDSNMKLKVETNGIKH